MQRIRGYKRRIAQICYKWRHHRRYKLSCRVWINSVHLKSNASAPGKIILFGEHFVVYGVKAILCAINKRVTVSASKIHENTISIKSNIGDLNMPPNKPITEIKSPLKPFYFLANKIIEKHNQNTGIEILVRSEIPLGVGLGSFFF